MLSRLVQHFVEKVFYRELSWYLFGQVMVQVSSLVSAVIVSRYLGPTNLGLFTFSQNFVSVFLSVLAGADFYLTWKIAKSTNPKKDLQESFVYKAVLHLVVAVVGIITSLVVLPPDVALLCLILFLPSVLQSFSIFSFYALSKNYALQTGAIQAVLAVTFLLLKIVGVVSEASLTYFVMVAAFDVTFFGVAMFLYVRFFKKDITHFFTDLPEVTPAKIFGFVAQISFSIFALFFWGLLLRIDQFLLAYFTNAHTIGLYAAAVKVAEMPNALAGVVTSALTSRIALLPTIEKNEIRRRFKIIVGSQAVIGGVISLALIIFAPVIVSVLYGQAFDGSVAILQVYALTIPLMFMNYVFHSMYGSFSLIKVQALNYFLALLINSVLGVIGFLLYGIFGVIFATVIAYAFCTIFTIGYMYKTILK